MSKPSLTNEQRSQLKEKLQQKLDERLEYMTRQVEDTKSKTFQELETVARNQKAQYISGDKAVTLKEVLEAELNPDSKSNDRSS
ncbi:hypothetical protein TPHA_0L00190 [Tetrapisispora phaffii CBS 4417]|uniref:Uncharacterized protein n=1 Tax=Tetrapisispora phaffii (strain ATCC 24235 / CBS 4417 / NBRC 1672 / NRRL Y-8282 / UCD 70-5) TaxID=1071381 RepID=G8BZP8_TETPH|nr:hypothetical protein TPHA_0L00190 [Tetrapisispora phaffii CBS 4417]CCE65376.1 hypothetical protein TPHA_0L00190 [Tetrapisispora phaffii CBS 4417]